MMRWTKPETDCAVRYCQRVAFYDVDGAPMCGSHAYANEFATASLQEALPL